MEFFKRPLLIGLGILLGCGFIPSLEAIEPLRFKNHWISDEMRVSALNICLNPPENPEVVKKMEQLLLGYFTPYKVTMKIEKSYLTQRLIALLGENYPLEVPGDLFIYKKTHLIPPEKITALVKEALIPLALPRNIQPETLNFRYIEEEKGFLLPFHPTEMSLKRGPGNLLGHHFLQIQFKGEGQEIVRPVRLEVSCSQNFLKTTAPIPIGGQITSKNTQLVPRTLFAMRQLNQVTNKTDLYRKVKRGLPIGAWVGRSDLQVDFLVKRFQTIPMVVQEGNLKVSGHAVSLEDAQAGDEIKLKLKNQTKTFSGLVLPDGSVRISL